MIWISRREYHGHITWLEFELTEIRKHLRRIERTMATQEELDAKLAELTDAVTNELKQLADAIAAQAPDLSPQVAKVQSLIDALKADDPAP